MIKKTIVYIDDQEDQCGGFADFAKDFFPNTQVKTFSDGREAMDWLRENKEKVALVVTDHRMPVLGTAVLEFVSKHVPDAGKVLISGYGEDQAVRTAYENGWIDARLAKACDEQTIRDTLASFLNRGASPTAIAELLQRLDEDSVQELFAKVTGCHIGPDTMMMARAVLAMANSNEPVLIRGETGSGKESVARMIHFVDALRRTAAEPKTAEDLKRDFRKLQKQVADDHPFVSMCCSQVPEIRIEVELFGHEAKVFTEVPQAFTGRFEQARNGTLFIDEIGELPMQFQVKFLRVLEECEATSIGGRKYNINARIVAATNRDLQKDVAAGRFREDLYYRLNQLGIYVPALRQRVHDIPGLVDYILLKKSKGRNGIADVEGTNLHACRWPGNVRQLEAACERALMGARAGVAIPWSLIIEKAYEVWETQPIAGEGRVVSAREFVELVLRGGTPKITRDRLVAERGAQFVVEVYNVLRESNGGKHPKCSQLDSVFVLEEPMTAESMLLMIANLKNEAGECESRFHDFPTRELPNGEFIGDHTLNKSRLANNQTDEKLMALLNDYKRVNELVEQSKTDIQTYANWCLQRDELDARIKNVLSRRVERAWQRWIARSSSGRVANNSIGKSPGQATD
jgi:two-component system response regulator HydG